MPILGRPKPLDAQYGRLRVIGREGHFAICECSCGSPSRRVDTAKLRSGKTLSCGCLAREMTAQRSRQNVKHGMSRTTEYRIWVKMNNRCHNPQNDGYAAYGGRGIVVCDRWRDSFENFLADMGRRPSNALTLDRRDNDGPYSPTNCRWATKPEQQRNTRRNVLVTAFGETRVLMDWANDPRCTVGYKGLQKRLRKGMTPEEAITSTPDYHGGNTRLRTEETIYQRQKKQRSASHYGGKHG